MADYQKKMVNDVLIFRLYLVLLVWLPLPLGSNRPWAWNLFELTVFMLSAVMLFQGRTKIAVTVSPVERTVPLTPVYLMLAFAGIIFLRAFFESFGWLPETLRFDLIAQFVHLRTTLAFAAFVFLTLRLVNSAERLKTLSVVIVFTGVFQAAYGSFMVLSGVEYGFLIKKGGYKGLATGTFWNRNHFANYLNLCLAVGTGLLLSQLYSKKASDRREKLKRLLTTLLSEKLVIRLGLAIMVIALVLSKSRMGNSAFFFSLFATSILWLALTRNFSRNAVLLLVSLFVIDSFIVGTWFGIDKVRERVQTTSFVKETRDEVNRDLIPMFKDHMVLGTGAGTFYTAFPQYRGADIDLYYDHAHNDYGEFFTEHGIVGMVPLILLVLLAYYHALRVPFVRQRTLFKAFSFTVIMGLTATLIHATVEFNLQIPANAVMFLLVISLAWIIRFMPGSTPSKRRLRERSK